MNNPPYTLSAIVDEIYDNIKNSTIKEGYALNIFADQYSDELFIKYFSEEYESLLINLSGHCYGQYDNKTIQQLINEQSNFPVNRIKEIYTGSLEWAIVDLIKGISKETVLEDFKYGLTGPLRMPEIYCHCCGASSKLYRHENILNLKSFSEKMNSFLQQQPCKFPLGLDHFSHVLNIESGKMVFSNDLRHLFSHKINKENDIYIQNKTGFCESFNSEYGKLINKEYWNNHGMAYIYTSKNPSIFVNYQKSSISIKVDYYYDSETDQEFDNEVPDETDLGRVDSDLRAVCAMDYSLFESLCKKRGFSLDDFIENNNCIIVDGIKKGEYIVTDYSNNAQNKNSKKRFRAYHEECATILKI